MGSRAGLAATACARPPPTEEGSELRLIRLLKKDLAAEMSTWVDGGLISADQARAICRQYGVDYDELRNRSSGYRALVFLGFLFVGLALITVIGANWESIPRGARMAGLLVLTAGTHGLATRLWLSERQSLATGMFILGNLFYGASIILIAQIYHLGEHMPDGVFWWALGSLPMAVLLRSEPLAVFSGLLALLWFVVEWRTGFLTPEFFCAAFPLFLAAELYVLARARAGTLLFVVFVVSSVLWLETSLAVLWMDGGRLEATAEQAFVGVAVFILAYAVSHLLNAGPSAKARDHGAVLSLWTLRFALIGMLVLSFEAPWEDLIGASWSKQTSMWGIMAALAVATLWIGSKTANLPILVTLIVLCGTVMVAVVASQDEASAVYFQVLDNVALVVAGIWLIVRGTVTATSHYFFLSVTVILLTAFLRYVDLIRDYLHGAALFMVLAVVLLASARYWKARQSNEARR